MLEVPLVHLGCHVYSTTFSKQDGLCSLGLFVCFFWVHWFSQCLLLLADVQILTEKMS